MSSFISQSILKYTFLTNITLFEKFEYFRSFSKIEIPNAIRNWSNMECCVALKCHHFIGNAKKVMLTQT